MENKPFKGNPIIPTYPFLTIKFTRIIEFLHPIYLHDLFVFCKLRMKKKMNSFDALFVFLFLYKDALLLCVEGVACVLVLVYSNSSCSSSRGCLLR